MTNDAIKDAELAVSEPQNAGKKEKNPFVLALQQQAAEYRIQEVLKINPKTWNELKDKNILPRNGTYGEFLTSLFSYYRQKNSSKVTRGDTVGEQKGSDEEIVALMRTEKIAKIKLDQAKETNLHIANLRERGKLIDKNEEFKVIEVLVRSIATVLRSAGDENPNLQPAIDKCFVTLFNLANNILTQVEEDRENYVQKMLDKPLDLTETIDKYILEDE